MESVIADSQAQSHIWAGRPIAGKIFPGHRSLSRERTGVITSWATYHRYSTLGSRVYRLSFPSLPVVDRESPY